MFSLDISKVENKVFKIANVKLNNEENMEDEK